MSCTFCFVNGLFKKKYFEKIIFMSYLTSHFITLSRPRFLKAKSPNSFYEPTKTKPKIKSKGTKKTLYHLKTIKQNQVFSFGEETKTETKSKPLILFINLLMKNGKKNHALRVLATTLSLFKARISKIKLEKHVGSLKKSSQSFYQYYLQTFEVPCFALYAKAINGASQITSSTSRIPYYKSQPNNFSLIFSRNNNIGLATSKIFSNHLHFLLAKYIRVFPFISAFPRLFNDFYLEKTFFCGKFVHLGPLKTNEKSNLFFSLFGKNNGTENFSLKQEKRRNFLNFKILGPVTKQSNPFFLEVFEKKKSIRRNFRKCLWYKALAKKSSWDKLTSLQKSSFLYCLFKAISNVKPPLECRTKRIGGSNKQIPSQVAEHRQWRIAISWIIEAAQNEFSKKKNKSTILDKEVYKTDFYNTLKTFENIQDKSKIVRGMLCQDLLRNTHYNPLGQKLSRLNSLPGNLNHGSNSTKPKKLNIKQGAISPETKMVYKGRGIIQEHSFFGPRKPNESQRTMAKPSKRVLYMPCNLESWVIKQKKNYISSLFKKSPQTGKLREHFKKTKFDYFCFYLAESLENAYYKKGPAMQKRNLWIETALTNRAFLRYRWW